MFKLEGPHSLVIRQQLFWQPYLPRLKHRGVRRVVKSTLFFVEEKHAELVALAVA